MVTEREAFGGSVQKYEQLDCATLAPLLLGLVTLPRDAREGKGRDR